MKIFSIFLSLLFLSAACVQEVPSYNSLTDAEKAEVMRRANDKCASDNVKDFTDYSAISNQALVDYHRGIMWQLDSKSGNATTSSFLYVWSRTATATYFLYKYKQNSTDHYQFIKMNTAVNALMIDDLKLQKCVAVTNRTISSPSTAFSLTFAKVQSYQASVLSETDTTFSANTNQPAFFLMFNKKIVVRTYNTDNVTVKTTDTTQYTFKTPIDQPTDLFASYLNYDPANTQFCIVRANAGTPATFTLPYPDLKCEISPSANVNTGDTAGNAAFDFFPAELGTY